MHTNPLTAAPCYVVSVAIALHALLDHDKEQAASWWMEHGHPREPFSCFAFMKEAIEVISPVPSKEEFFAAVNHLLG